MSNLRYYTDVPPILLTGPKWVVDLRPHIIDMTASRSTDQVGELTVNIDDPNFALCFQIGNPNGMAVNTMNLDYIVDSYDVDAGGGLGGMVLHCRPRTVRRLKSRAGAYVMKNVSPTTWVQREIEAVGGRFVGQPSATRATVARDVIAKDSNAQNSEEKPSSWTTCNRLADELGYVFYEDDNVYYFGKPSWLINNTGHARLDFNDQDPTRRYTTLPTYQQSLDDQNTAQATIVIPVEQSVRMTPGMRVDLVGFPFWNTAYFLSSMEHSVTPGSGDLTLSLKLPIDPEVSTTT